MKFRTVLIFVFVFLTGCFIGCDNSAPVPQEVTAESPYGKISWRGSFESAPSDPEKYDVYFNTTDGCTYIYNGTQWSLMALKGDKGDAGATGVQGEQGVKGLDGQSIVWKGSLRSAPNNPEELWAYYNTENGCSYIFSNGVWKILAGRGVSISWLGSFAIAPDEPVLYEAYYNTTDGCSYIYDGTKWTMLAQKGSKGDTGAQGEQGVQGIQGASIIWKGEYEDYPENPEELWAFFSLSTGCSFIYSGGEWQLLAVRGAYINWLGSYATVPTDAEYYDAYFNTTDGCTYIYSGEEWILIAQKGDKGNTGEKGDPGLDGESIVWKGNYTSSDELTEPEELWAYYNTTDGCSYIYKDDSWNLLALSGATVKWLGAFDTAPENPEVLDTYYNTTDGCSYIYYGGKWSLMAQKGAKGDTGAQGETGLDGQPIVWKGSYSSSSEISEPLELWAYFNTVDGCSYIYTDGSWTILSRGGRTINWLGGFASAPVAPALYDAYYNTTDYTSYIYDGSGWCLIATKGDKGAKGDKGDKGLDGTSIIWLGALSSAPSSPTELCAYFNTSDGCSYIYHNDAWEFLSKSGTSIYWCGSFDEAPSNPSLYWAYFNNLTGCSYIYDGTEWTLLASKGDVGETGQTGAKGADGADGTSIIWKGSYAYDSDIENPEELWAYYNTSNGCSYIYSGGSWQLLASSSTMDSERTMIIGYVDAEERSSKSGIYVTLTSVTTTETVYKTYTNSSGYFAFSSLSAGEYIISVAESGYEAATSESISVQSGKTSDAGTINLKLEKGVLTGQVKLDATTDYSGVTVELIGTDYSTTTDTDGVYMISLKPGTYSGGVRYQRKNYATVINSDSIVITKNTQTSLGKTSLNATHADTVSGTVKVTGLSDYSGVEVQLLGTADYTTTTDSTGFFKFTDVLIGDYTLKAKKEGLSSYSRSVTVTGNAAVKLGTFTYEYIELKNPTFSYAEGTYDNTLSLEISGTTGAEIYYTTDGSVPTTESTLYEGAVNIDRTTTVRAISHKSGVFSDVSGAEYVIKAGDVTADVTAGYYSEAKSIELSCSTSGAEIYYTLDSSTPTKTGISYTTAIKLSDNATLKAVAYKDSYEVSDVFTAEYTFNKPSSPSVSLGAGTYEEGRGIKLTSDGGSIYYTTDGTAPTLSSTLYTSEIPLSKNMTLKAFVYKNGLRSAVLTAAYKVKVVAPKANVKAGTYLEEQTVSLSTTTEGAEIYYTTDGKTPSEMSTRYTGPIAVKKNTTIKTIAVKTGLETSDTSSFDYIIDKQSGGLTIVDPDYRDFSITSSSGWTSGVSVNAGTSGKLTATLIPVTIDAVYSWYIDGELISGAESINIGSYTDILTAGVHIIMAEVKVGDDVYSDNFLLKVTK